MLTIQGYDVHDVNERPLNRVFGESCCWTDEFEQYIREKIASGGCITIRDLLENYLSSRRTGGYLAINTSHLHSDYNKAYIISMSGDRNRDNSAARRKAGCGSSIPHYRWHHCERIWATMTGINCKMYLVDETYHSAHHHKGGVDEYHYIFSTGYGRT